MAVPDPHQPAGTQPGEPPTAQPPLPQAQPLPSSRRLPQAQPIQPSQPLPQSRPTGQGQPSPPRHSAAPAGHVERTARPTVAVGRPGAARPVLLGDKTGTASVRPRDEESEQDISTMAVRNSPPWLISAVFHMSVLIILGLLLIPDFSQSRIEVKAIYAETLGDQLDFDSPAMGNDLELEDNPFFSLSELPPVPDPLAAPPNLSPLVDGNAAVSEIEVGDIGLALKGREQGRREASLRDHGGTELTEEAVIAGLQWLAKNQRADGSWSLRGPYANGAISENPAAATAMALLAFQGQGYTHLEGERHKENVARGWQWLLKEQDADGSFFRDFRRCPFNHRFYTQGQCAIAICELYGMSKDSRFREPAERAIRYCLKSQSDEGGWRYNPRSESDVSVTGWIVMGLQSAKMAGLEVPQEHLDRVQRFLDTIGTEGGTRYPYMRRESPRLSMTAEALLCRQYLGWSRNDKRLLDGVEYLTRKENLVNYHRDRDVYCWYYATQVLHHMGGRHWKRWNSVMRQAVPEQQVKSGPEAGSWDPLRPTRDSWEAHGGRLYVTCLSIYMLEVYYRYMPIYRWGTTYANTP